MTPRRFAQIISILFSVCLFGQAEIHHKAFVSRYFNEAIDLAVFQTDTSDHSPGNLVFFFHGFGSSPEMTLKSGLQDSLFYYARNGKLKNTIVIIPDGYKTYYTDNWDDSIKWESMFYEELLPALREKYRSDNIYLTGFSMGGYGALTLFLKSPRNFDGIFTISAAIRSDSTMLKMPYARYKLLYKNVFGPEQKITTHWTEANPFYLLTAGTNAGLHNKKILMTCGKNDYLLPGNSAFSLQLKSQHIPHRFMTTNGKHSNLFMLGNVMQGLIELTSH